MILLFVAMESFPIFREASPWRLLSDESWHPKERLYNLTPMLLASLLATLGAVVIAGPLGVLSGVFCHHYAPKPVISLYRRMIELLAGIPSVVYGFWGLTVLVPIVNEWHAPGASLFSGIVVLAIMIFPTTALVADAAVGAVPRSYLNAAHALGLSRRGLVALAVLPAARSSLVTGIVLGMGRAVGETMAVLMVTGNNVQIPLSVFDPVRTLTANIALEMAYATGNHRSALFASGLLLLLVVGAMMTAASMMSWRFADA